MKKLTDSRIKSLKPKDKVYEVAAGDGLKLRVWPTGRKTFCYVYRSDGRLKRYTIGTYDETAFTLHDARTEHNKLVSLRNTGVDPVSSKTDSLAEDFKALSSLFLKIKASHHKDKGEKYQRSLEKDILPYLGSKPVSKITRRDVAIVTDKVLKRGANRQANITLQMIKTILNFGVDRGWIEFNPVARMKAPGNENGECERVLSPDEIKQFWNEIETDRMSADTVRALRLILVTGQRPGEVVGMSDSEIKDNWWTIPAERAKNGQEHRVYLSPLAKSLAGPFDIKNAHVLSTAVRRLLKEKKDGTKNLEMDHWTPHDLRRSCSTEIAKLGFLDEEIDWLLNHKQKKIRRTYNLHRYDDLKKKMLLAWERKLLKYLGAPRLAKVANIDGGAR